MKLNHNCVRDLLLFIEDNLTYSTYIYVNEIQLEGYTQEEIIYSADKLLDAGYITGTRKVFLGSDGTPQIEIKSITWDGHQFLDNIRDNKVWEQTKGILSKFSSVSIGIISNVASQVISNIIKSQMGLL
ncbi:MAG: DUF2513 domain-containing protein [Thermoanaerobacteraceae bacterium]|nr:DUF2513 domain-containing protein [Thermoanaerobacteraceae bacterium]